MDPITISLLASAGIKIVGSILGYNAKKQEAKANKKAALQNLGLMYNDLNARAAQERAAASQARETVQEQAGALEGQTTVSAASGNVAGATVDALLGDVSRQEGRALSTIDANLGFTEGQIKREQRGAHARAQQQIAGVKSPSWASLGLQIGATGLNTYASLRG